MTQPRTPPLDLDLTSANPWLHQTTAPAGSPDDTPAPTARTRTAPLWEMRCSDGADAWRHKQPAPRAPPAHPKPRGAVVPAAEMAAALREKDEQLAALQETASALATQLRGSESRVVILEARVSGAEHGARQLQVGIDQASATSSAALKLLAEYRRARYSATSEEGREGDDDGAKHPPSRDEVLEIATHLKFDLKAHPSLEWLAREAIDAPLPAGWSEHTDDSDIGRAFFFHQASGRRQWSHPHDGLFSQLYSNLSAVLQPADE